MTLTDPALPEAPPRNRRGLPVERRGIDHIPEAERRGSVRQLGLMWSGVVLNVQMVVYGTLLVIIGLSVWQAVAAIAIGNLTWIVTGLCSLVGPASGTTAFVSTRAAFGVRAARPLAVFNWIQQVGYEVLGLVLMVLATSALLDLAGVHVSTAAQVGLVLVLAVVQSILPVLGHAAITRIMHVMIGPSALLFLVLTWLTVDRVDVSSSVHAGWATFLGGVALAASASGLGWSPNASDFSRYLPTTTPRRSIVAAVALGGGIPQSLLMVLGVLVASYAPLASDPISGLPDAYPHWLVVPYLVLVLAQTACVNSIDLYSSGVTLQAIGLKVGRWQAVAVDGVVCAALAVVVVLSGDVNAFISNFLLFMIVWFSPWAAIYVVDYFLRRGRYDVLSLSGADGGRYVRPGGVHVPGVVAQLAGMLASAAFIWTSVFVGPGAAALGGADLSVPAGLLVGGGLYYLLARTSVAAESAL